MTPVTKNDDRSHTKQCLGALKPKCRLCYDKLVKSQIAIDPGIIKTFRLFIGVRLGLLIFSLLVYFLASGWSALNYLPMLAFMLLDAGLLFAYLSLPKLGELLKRMYLPVGIIWATIGPIIQLHLVFLLFTSVSPERSAILLVLQLILVTFIPLVIISWLYPMRTVILFCSLTFLFDALLVLIANVLSGVTVSLPIMGIAFIRTVMFLLVGNMVANLMKTQREQHQRLADANNQLAQYAAALEQLTISRERNRMARELHDVMAHTMSGVAVELEGVKAMLRVDPDQAETLLGQSLGAVREGLSETRRALQSLRAAPLEDLGLGLAVRNMVESIAGKAGLKTDLRIENNLPVYPAEVQQCFYRVAQEALTNVIAHSQASQVQVCLMREETLLKLLILDDGVGFDEKVIDLDQKYGLLGMRERVEMIHGDLSIVSQVGSGTQIVLTYGGNH